VSSVASVVTAIATSVTTVGGVILTWKGLIPAIRTGKDTLRTAEETHHLVNQSRTDAAKYTQDLTDLLQSHDISIPHDKSLE
jgi:predicted tellurium resistance membrane protein TerC